MSESEKSKSINRAAKEQSSENRLIDEETAKKLKEDAEKYYQELMGMPEEKKKYGGKINYRMGGGQVVDASYDN